MMKDRALACTRSYLPHSFQISPFLYQTCPTHSTCCYCNRVLSFLVETISEQNNWIFLAKWCFLFRSRIVSHFLFLTPLFTFSTFFCYFLLMSNSQTVVEKKYKVVRQIWVRQRKGSVWVREGEKDGKKGGGNGRVRDRETCFGMFRALSHSHVRSMMNCFFCHTWTASSKRMFPKKSELTKNWEIREKTKSVSEWGSEVIDWRIKQKNRTRKA